MKTKIGLTELYNQLHDPLNNHNMIDELRSFRVKLDQAALEAYGWSDIEIGHIHRAVFGLPENDCVRFSISELAQAEVLRRLSALNKRRRDEEAENQLATSAVRSSRTSRARSLSFPDQNEFGFEPPSRNKAEETAGADSAAEKIVSYLEEQRSWLSKADILAYADVPDGQWNAAINDLLSRGIVERQGERRGARYRIIEGD